MRAGEPCDPLDAFLVALAKAADLCLKPHLHALRFSGEPPATIGEGSDCVVLIEARTAHGQRVVESDLELEIYRSGDDLNLMLSRLSDEQAPMLWHGSHAVWMEPASGERCDAQPMAHHLKRSADGFVLAGWWVWRSQRLAVSSA